MKNTKDALIMIGALAMLSSFGAPLILFWQWMFPHSLGGQLGGVMGSLSAVVIITAIIADLRSKGAKP